MMNKYSILNFSFWLTFLCLSPAFAEIIQGEDNDCGTNCKWSLNTETGELKFEAVTPSSDGKTSYEITSTPWSDWGAYRTLVYENATSVNITEGVESLPNGAFQGNGRITSVSLPEGLKEIGKTAFGDCTHLTNINIPSTITKIGERAFLWTKLTEVNMPDSVQIIGQNAFYGAPITNVTIGENTPLRTSAVDVSLYSDTFDENCSWCAEDLQRYIDLGYITQEQADAARQYFLDHPDEYQYVVSYVDDSLFFADGYGIDLSLGNITINCAGDMAVCKAKMLAAGYEEGTYNMVQAAYSKKNSDGSTSYFDAEGKLIATEGKINKRIYTVEEATKLSKPTGNIIKLRYK